MKDYHYPKEGTSVEKAGWITGTFLAYLIFIVVVYTVLGFGHWLWTR